MSQAWNGTKKESPERRTYTVEDIAQILGIGRTSAYLLVKEGDVYKRQDYNKAVQWKITSEQ